MTDDNDGTLTLSLPFVFRENPSALGPNAEHAKIVAGDESRGHLLCFVGVVGEGDENRNMSCDIEPKCSLQIFIILKRRCAEFRSSSVFAEYRVQRTRISNGSGGQEQGIEE